MPIETICQTCNNRLRVADQHAGKLARCPKCQSVYTVPTLPSAGEAFAPLPSSHSTGTHSTGTQSTATPDQWRLKTGDGMIYGPVSRADMDRWLTEGRVTPDSQLLQEGTEKWLSAGHVYPQLATAGFGAPGALPSTSTLSPAYTPTGSAFGNQYGSAASTPAAGGNPFASSNPFSEASVQQSPYTSPAYPGMPSFGQYARPHRGVLILVLGILGLSVCGLIGFPAAFMGMSDLREMYAGRMDPSGKGLTIAGMIMGWICVAILAMVVFFIVIGAVAG